MSPLLAGVLLAGMSFDQPAAAPASASAALDAVVSAAWKPLNVLPEAPADDPTFLRRVWLDLTGRIPPIAEARKFLDSQEPDKRTKLVDQLLKSKDFANHWARFWTQEFTDKRPFDQDGYNGAVLQAWLRDALQANTSYRQIVEELIAGSGSSEDSGPANFLLRYDVDPVQLAGAVSKKFLGLTVQCAQCHDHPHAKWRKDDFWGLAAYFGRLRRLEPTGNFGGEFVLVMERNRGELQIPDDSAKTDENGQLPQKSVYPRLPGTRFVETSAARRASLAAWITGDKNPYFAKHAVNRVWANIMGSTLLPSFDKLADEPDSPRKAILEHLSARFAADGYNVQNLLRTIVLSETYQRGSGTLALQPPSGPKSAAETTDLKLDEARHRQLDLFARAPVRPLTADQVYLSMVQVTGYRGGEEAARLAETTQQDYISDIPGDNFSDQPLSVHRALSLLNGDFVREAIRIATESARRQFGEAAGVEHIRWLFLAALSREPTPEEVEDFLELASAGEQGLADVVWVVFNSAEFNSNH